MKYQTKETAFVIKHWGDIPDNFTGVINYFRSYHWFANGKKHRDDGPAIIHYNGIKEWYLNGAIHRENGPAIIYPSGEKSWYLNGIKYTQEEWFERLTSEQKEKAIWNMDNW